MRAEFRPVHMLMNTGLQICLNPKMKVQQDTHMEFVQMMWPTLENVLWPAIVGFTSPLWGC